MSVGEGPRDFVVAPIDGDDYQDVVVASFDSDDITVLRSNGVGGFFSKSIDLGSGVCPSSIVAAHFNPRIDAHLDIAVKGHCDNSVHLLLGDGQGGFTKSLKRQPPSGAIDNLMDD